MPMNAALLPWLPAIVLAAVLVVGIVIRYSGGNEPVPPAPPAPHHDAH